MSDKEIKIAKILDDIQEIDSTLSAQIFDREKAEDIIRKHNQKDAMVAMINSPLSSHYVTFEIATDDMVKNNLLIIRQVLLNNLAKESGNGQA